MYNIEAWKFLSTIATQLKIAIIVQSVNLSQKTRFHNSSPIRWHINFFQSILILFWTGGYATRHS